MCCKKYVFFADTQGYIDMAVYRIGGYPIFLNICLYLFGDLKWAYWIQTLLSFLSMYQISTYISSQFKNSPYIVFMILLSGMYIYCSYIISECLAYPFFLLSFYFLMKHIIERDLRSFMQFCITVGVLCFIRQQYIIFYAAGLFLCIFGYVQNWEKSLKKISYLIISYMAVFVSERTYHYHQHGRFSSTPFMYQQACVLPIFLSDEKDRSIFLDNDSKKVFLNVHHQLKNDPMISWINWYKKLYNGYYNPKHFDEAYLKIYFSLHSSFGTNVLDYKTPDKIKKLYDFEDQCQKICLTLIQNNFLKYINALWWTIVVSFGGYWYFLLICVFILMIRVFKNFSCEDMILLVLGGLLILNISLVVIFEPLLDRYIYTCQSLFLSLLASRLFKKRI
jgi:hypothetical protein